MQPRPKPRPLPRPRALPQSTSMPHQNMAQFVMASSPAPPASPKPVSAVAQHKIAQQAQPQPPMSQLKLRQTAAEEILTSEQTYVDQLRICIQTFKNPIESSKLLDQETLHHLFANMEPIYALHAEFLEELKKRMRQWTSPSEQNSIGDIMEQLIPPLKIYQDYINNYDKSVKVLNKLCDKNNKFVQLLNCLGTGTFVGKMGLDLLRGVPVQRITRYVLLLKQLLKYTPEDHEDYNKLKEAYEKMYRLAEFINEKKRESESRTRLLHIAHHLSGNLEGLRESGGSPQITREHKWKTKNKSKACDYCGQMAMGSYFQCNHKHCKYRAHQECKDRAPSYCMDRTKVSLVKHNRYLVEEVELNHKMTSLEHPDSRAKLRPVLVLIVNDGMVILHTSEHGEKYNLLAFIRWFKKSSNEYSILNENVTENAFSLTDPRTNMLHTFSTDSKQKKHLIELIQSLMDKWRNNILEKQRENEEVKEQFKGLTFKILFTVPVHSSTEKEFTAYVVELRMENGSATLIKRYRQFLSLHKKLKTLYKNVPPFPGKKFVGNTSPKFVQKRCRRLEEYLNKIITFPGIFDIEEVLTFLMTTISSKGEDERALIRRGWTKDKDKIEEISRQRSNTVSHKLEAVKFINSRGSICRFEDQEDEVEATQSSENGGGSDIATGPSLGTISRLSRNEGEMSNIELSLWSQLQGQIQMEDCKQQEDPRDNKAKEPTEAGGRKWLGSARTPAVGAAPTAPTPAPATEPNPSTRPAPTTPTKETKMQAVVLYDFVSQSPEELDVAAGDVLTVWEKSNEEWWFGTANGRDFGFFPKIYVQPIRSEST